LRKDPGDVKTGEPFDGGSGVIGNPVVSKEMAKQLLVLDYERYS
jgi:hypothetical protein